MLSSPREHEDIQIYGFCYQPLKRGYVNIKCPNFGQNSMETWEELRVLFKKGSYPSFIPRESQKVDAKHSK